LNSTVPPFATAHASAARIAAVSSVVPLPTAPNDSTKASEPPSARCTAAGTSSPVTPSENTSRFAISSAAQTP
jgi:hypothetical protein